MYKLAKGVVAEVALALLATKSEDISIAAAIDAIKKAAAQAGDEAGRVLPNRIFAIYASGEAERQPPGGWVDGVFLNEVGQHIPCKFYIADGHYLAGKRVGS